MELFSLLVLLTESMGVQTYQWLVAKIIAWISNASKFKNTAVNSVTQVMICVIISIVKTLGGINILENTNILINNEFNAAKVRYYTFIF